LLLTLRLCPSRLDAHADQRTQTRIARKPILSRPNLAKSTTQKAGSAGKQGVSEFFTTKELPDAGAISKARTFAAAASSQKRYSGVKTRSRLGETM
jgi:hypothetical protein